MAAISSPRPFTAEDFAKRMQRAAEEADAAGLTGVLVTPGPDLVYLAGYAPVAITERLTVLIVRKNREPAMVLPVLERPDAEAAPSAGTIALTDWADGSDPYAAAAPLLDPGGSYAVSDSAWALQLLGLQEALPDTRFVAVTTALPMLRAIKDADELERLAVLPGHVVNAAGRRPVPDPEWGRCSL
jgi:Xaa-Pro aminopeptidase